MTFDELSGLIGQLNIHDDAIVMDSKIRDLADLFHADLADQQQLRTIFQHLNRQALADEHFAINMAVFFGSRVLDSVLPAGSDVRAEMCTVLEENFMNADSLKLANPAHFHNSITLLGEYYHRVRVAASPILILGQSLLQLLTAHLRSDIDRHLLHHDHHRPSGHPDRRFAKLILRQLTLNGPLVRRHHRADCETLLFECRRCLVLCGAAVCTETRALLLMTLDLYYSNFGSLGTALEELYVTYLMADGDGEAAAAAASKPSSTAAGEIEIGVRAPGRRAEPEASSIQALRGELRREASGYQRPSGNADYLARPKNARERLQFVRAQTAAELDRESQAFSERQRSFEKVVQQQKEQQQLPTTTSANLSPQQSPSRRTPLLLASPKYANSLAAPASPSSTSGNGHLLNAAVTTPSPRSSKSCASPRTARNNGATSSVSLTPSTTVSVHSSPAKTPLSARRPRPLATPVSPPQNSDWYAECVQSYEAGVQRAQQEASQEATTPLVDEVQSNASSAVSPRLVTTSTAGLVGGMQDWNHVDWNSDDWNSFDTQSNHLDDDGENRETPQLLQEDEEEERQYQERQQLQQQMNDRNSLNGRRSDGSGGGDAYPKSPSGQRRVGGGGGGGVGGGRRNGGGGGGRRNNRSRTERANGGGGSGSNQHHNNDQHQNNDSGSRYASKASLQSSASFRRGGTNGSTGGNGDRNIDRQTSQSSGSSNQLKPANRNNPFDRPARPAANRLASKSRHDQHCDRGESGNEWRYGNDGGAKGGNGNNGSSPPQAATGRRSAARLNKEFLQFLDD